MVGRALTIKANGIARVLHTDAHILIANTTNGAKVKAIWDTGATGSVITKKVSKALGLIPTGFAQVHTANGVVAQNTFTIDIGLPNGVIIQGVTVTEVDGLSGGCEGLIGMDIISLGDFSITNHNGKTCMSFRVPSGHEIDYVTNPNYGMTPIKHISTGKPGSNTQPKKKKRR